MPYPVAASRGRVFAPGSAAPPPPPQPPFDNIAACWGLFNFNNDGYAGPGVNISGSDISTIMFTADPPYPLQWANVTDAGDPPYSLIIWYDQNGNTNDLAGPFGARPILDATNKLISFDGVSQGLQGAGNLFPSHTTAGTLYFDFAPQSLVETGVILETGQNEVQMGGRISIRMVAGVLTVSFYDATAIVALPNTKAKIISSTNRIWVAVTFDTSLAAANQVQLYVNNSQAGVTAPASADLSAVVGVGVDVPNVGARNNAASNYLTANMWEIRAETVVDAAAAMLVQYNYWNYLKTQ